MIISLILFGGLIFTSFVLFAFGSFRAWRYSKIRMCLFYLFCKSILAYEIYTCIVLSLLFLYQFPILLPSNAPSPQPTLPPTPVITPFTVYQSISYQGDPFSCTIDLKPCYCLAVQMPTTLPTNPPTFVPTSLPSGVRARSQLMIFEHICATNVVLFKYPFTL